MKNKPISHKNQNTFKFIPLAERISKINIDVIHQVSKASATPDDATTHFLETFEKWTDLNYSQDYGDLQKEIGSEIRNLKEIVFRQNDIIEILLKFLKRENSLALDAVLELIVALARDLQHDFYPHFPKFFSAIVLHLSTKDTELLEKLFTCLAYLFKFLWKYMIKDIENVYRLFSSLLGEENKEHIRIFAVESFAFLIRRIRDKKTFFLFIFEELKKNPKQSPGVGQLFFEIVKGVKEHFHSCTEEVLKLLLQLLDKENCNVIEGSLKHTVTFMTRHTLQKINCFTVQKVFCDVIGELIGGRTAVEASVAQHLDRVLHLFLIWVGHREGALLSPDPLFTKILIDLCKLSSLPVFCLKSIADIVSCVLLSDCLTLTQDKVIFMIEQIYSCSEEVFLHFNRAVIKCKMYEKDVLPHLLSACLRLLRRADGSEKLALLTLAETVVSLRPDVSHKEDIDAFAKLYMCFPSKDVSSENGRSCYDIFEKFLLQVASVENVHDSNMSELWSALVCLPHLRNLKVRAAADVLQKLLLSLETHLLSQETNHKKAEEYGFVLYQAYFVNYVISRDSCISLPSSSFVSLLKKYPRCVSILRLVDLHFTVSEKAFRREDLTDFLPCLVSNLASPLHLVRFFTLKILNKFSSCFNQENQGFSIFSVCFEAENVPLNVQCYREKLKWLRKLEYEFLEKQFVPELKDSLEKVPISYLVGMLFVNFRLLWDPAMDVLETYAHRTVNNFWDVFVQHLYSITEMCEKNDSFFEELDEPGDSDLPFTKCLAEFCRSGENPDIGNHRVLLWKAMEKFPDVAETKNRMIVPLLFKLMTNEVVKVDNSVAVKEGMSKETVSSSQVYEEGIPNRVIKRKLKETCEQSNKKKCTEVTTNKEEVISESAKNSLEEGIEYDNDEDDEEEEEDSVQCPEPDEINENVSSTVRKIKGWNERKLSVAKALAAYLTVFSKFRNPKALYKTEELQNLYCELLSYHNPVIQKLSFDCLVTYNYKYIMPYKDHFYRILDNKTFKHEIVLFSLDAENAVIEKEHRKEALAILMRILYGKMLYQTGSKTTGKSLANTRRSLVLRFLAGCTAEELRMFFELAFLPYLELMKDSTLEAVKKIRESLDFANVVPLRRQHSALNSLGLIFQHLGNLVPELLPWLLKLLLIILATSTTLLEKREEVLSHCVSILKSIRTLAVMKLIQFFQSFSNYSFQPQEIDAIFESFVWTMLPRLKLESANQPSPLIRLFSAWSENPRYFILFSKHHESSESLSPLPHIIELYSSQQAKPRVVGAISKIFFRFVSAKDGKDGEENATPLEINHSLCFMKEETNGDTNSYGIKLLLPYVNAILKRLETTIFTVAKKKSKKSLSSRDLTILLRISPYVKGSEQSCKLVCLLVPFLMKPNSDPDMEILILNSIKNLIPKVEDSASLIKLLPPLFGKVSSISSRAALVDVFSTAAKSIKEISSMVQIIKKINAFDREMLEEPDYQQRLDGHREAIELIQNMPVADEDFIRILIFNSAFDIKTYADIALRNSSSKLLQDVARIASNFQDTDTGLFRRIVFDALLPEIQEGLKCSDELQRHEFITVLSTVLHGCNQPQLKELASLCHKDKDLDFWENLKHLQVHRRARALLRFSDGLRVRREKGERVDPHPLQAYLIPILKTFLFDDAYKKHVHVIDAAIETLGSVASVLSWHQYELLLKQYLQLIPKDAQHHKTVVKIVVSLLNAFPFNLKEVKVATVESNDTEELTKTSSSSLYELTPEMGNKMSRSIKKNILPLLHQSLMKKSKSDDEHKLARHYYPEDEEILRVPIALAMVKLLQKMPSGTLEKALPGLFLRMCDLLKSRTESIRETTRETLIKMMQCLGPSYFHFLLKEMRGVMKRGYQVHVMIFTINAVLLNIADQLSAGDLDDSLKDLVEICVEELFSSVAEEKEVAKITGKLKEARHVKSYSIFKILSKFVSETLLAELLLPLKEVLDSKHSHKSVGKIADCLRSVALGLSENAGVSERGLLEFVHCMVSQNISSVKKNKAPSQSSKHERVDSYLLPQEPGRGGPPAKINGKTNHHVLVEFGLQILNFCLKKDKINIRELDFLKMLDPFVQLLSDCLSSNHIKIISTSLRCLLPLYQHPLPSFKTYTKKIVNTLFVLINKYAGPGMARGENFEMVVMCFKTMTVLVRDTVFSEDECHSLLSYVEQDIFDSCRQATAFSLLKAILSKRMASPELAGIMSRVAEMSITSEQDHIRAQCRQLSMQYMLDYPLGKKLEDTIAFFNKQLEYPHEDGRRSCIEIINSMISNFPHNVLKKHSTVFLLHLSMRLVNDESSHCRKMSTECLGQLLQKVDHDGRAVLFPVIFQLLQDKKMAVKRVGAQVCGLFAEVEGEQFEHHLLEILPIYIDFLKDTAYQKNEKEPDKRCADHFLYHLLNSLMKMLSCCSVLRKPQYSSLLNEFWEELQGVLLYPHIWVRLAASHLFGLLFSSYTAEEMREAILHKDPLAFIHSREKLRSLSTDFCTQIQSVYVNDSLGEQIVRNLIFLGKVMSSLPELDEGDLIGWMIRRMCREARKEVTEASNVSLRRKYVFMFIAAIAHEIGKEKLVPYLSVLLAPLCREIADASKYIDESLRKTAQEVLDLIQNVVGVEEFSKQYASAQATLLKKKTERKRKKTQDAVKFPEKFAKRKIKKQLQKKESNKRKLLRQKGRKKVKKQKLSDIVITS